MNQKITTLHRIYTILSILSFTYNDILSNEIGNKLYTENEQQGLLGFANINVYKNRDGKASSNQQTFDHNQILF